MQLADDYALSAVDDERAILGHQRNVTEEDFLLFDIANALSPGLSILIENREANGDFERSRVRHAALLALVYVVLELQADRVAALVAKIGSVGVVGAALSAKNLAGMKRVGNNRGSAIAAGGAKVVDTSKVSTTFAPPAAIAVPEFLLRYVIKVRYLVYRLEDGVKTVVDSLARTSVYLQ